MDLRLFLIGGALLICMIAILFLWIRVESKIKQLENK